MSAPLHDHPFKVGDRVRVVEPHPATSLNRGDQYEVREIYRRHGDVLVRLVGNKRAYYASRFELASVQPSDKTDATVYVAESPSGARKGVKLARFDLIPAEALEQVAEVFGHGSTKYEDNNWRKGYKWSWSFAAMMRHAWAFWRGETYDPESGLHHMAHAAFHALVLIQNTKDHQAYDDRWTK